MCNFAVPAVLKAWIAGGQKYDAASGLDAYGNKIPYLRHILGFIGITDVRFVQAVGTVRFRSLWPRYFSRLGKPCNRNKVDTRDGS